MLLNTLLRHANAHPEKLAFVSDGKGASYGLFARIALSVREWAEKAVPEGGGIAAVCGGSILSQWVTIIALRSLGRATVSVADLQSLQALRLPAIDVIVVPPGSNQPSAVSPNASGPPMVAMPADIIRNARERSLPALPIGERLGDFIEYTSGTTGNYKAITRTGEGFAALCARTMQEFRISPDTVFHFGTLPPWCAVGSKCPVTVWHEGGACVFDGRRDWLEHLLDWPVNRMFSLPSMLEKLAEMEFVERREALQIYTGGGFLSYPAVRALRDRLSCNVFFNYAGTEFGVRLQNRVEDEEDVVWLRQFGGSRLEIVDENGIDCGIGVQGVVRAVSDVCDPVGYIGDPEASRAFFRDGLFYTGDLAIRREDGRIRVLGRIGDVLNVGGSKKPVAPIESLMRELLDVENLCLFARQSAQGEEFLLLVIEGKEECDPGKIGRLRKVFAEHFPDIVIRYTSEFPRKGPMQKVDRAALIEMVQQLA